MSGAGKAVVVEERIETGTVYEQVCGRQGTETPCVVTASRLAGTVGSEIRVVESYLRTKGSR
jgi:hypothetical protein